MFISKKHLSRRSVLKGVGAAVALPLLDAMVPARTALAAAARPAPRMAFVYFPHGAIMSEWTPAETAGPMQLGRILQPLAPFKDRVTIVSGLENRHAYGPVHAITPGTWLSGVPPRPGADPSRGITADQLAARHLSTDTLLPSIEVATEEPRRIAAGAWEGDYDASFGRTISFRRSSVPLSMDFNPRTVFDRLFAPGATASERALRAERSTSVLDLVAADAANLETGLGPADCALFRDYLDSVRDVERRVETAGADAGSERLRLMFDMIALAFRADITRVASFMMAAETSQMRYDEAGVPDAFHPLSHHQNDAAKLEKLVRIQACHTRALAAFVRTLADSADGDGSLLDRSLILYGSNMSDSHAHDHFPLPLAVLGGGCGALRGGRHLRYPDRTPHSNLLVALLRRAGVPVESVGDSTGECAEL